LIEPLAVAVHAVRLAEISEGECIAIFGAGAIGLLILQVAKAMGAGDVIITDIRENRLDAALRFGATLTFNDTQDDVVERIAKQTGGIGVKCAFEAVGREVTLIQTLQSLQKGGKGVLVGLFEIKNICIPANIFVQKEISLVGSQGYHWDFQRAIKLVQGGEIDLERMVTHQFDLEEVQVAFDVLQDPDQDVIKAVITNP